MPVFTLQRIFVAAMAVAMFGFFIVPRALARHQTGVVIALAVILALYLVVNLWLLRKRSPAARR